LLVTREYSGEALLEVLRRANLINWIRAMERWEREFEEEPLSTNPREKKSGEFMATKLLPCSWVVLNGQGVSSQEKRKCTAE